MGRFLLWLLVAWPVPALIAGALGWKGVWGSGSALADYLIPIPVAGGALHVVTLAGVTVLLLTQATWPASLKGLARGMLLGVAIAGALLAYDLDRGRFSENPLALFLLTDGLLAQFFVGFFGGRWPSGGREWVGSLIAALALPAAGAAYALMPSDPYRGAPFIYYNDRPGPAKADRIRQFHARVAFTSPDFRPKAAAFVEQWNPRHSVDDEDAAFHFFAAEAEAKGNDESKAVATYCMYQDGTPPAWHEGKGDCFAHESVTDRLRMTGSRERACAGVDLSGALIHQLCKTR